MQGLGGLGALPTGGGTLDPKRDVFSGFCDELSRSASQHLLEGEALAFLVIV